MPESTTPSASVDPSIQEPAVSDHIELLKALSMVLIFSSVHGPSLEIPTGKSDDIIECFLDKERMRIQSRSWRVINYRLSSSG